jgi:hypothetical protein
MMTLTRDMIDRLRFDGRMEIDAELEARLLRQFGEEPYPETYSGQDLQEQARKYVQRDARGKETVS